MAYRGSASPLRDLLVLVDGSFVDQSGTSVGSITGLATPAAGPVGGRLRLLQSGDGPARLSGFEHHRLAPVWYRLGSLLFYHGGRFYNFRGLREFKEKFDPEWEPRYLAGPGGLATPLVLTRIAGLVSGGGAGVLMR